PNFSCQASIVYVPGGRPEMVKLPSAFDTAKNGSGRTPTYACIQPCTLHSRLTITSGAANVRVVFMPADGWLTLNGRLALASALAGPATTFSSVGGFGYFALHAASSLMSIAGFLGATPVNLTLPVIVPPAAPADTGSDDTVGCVEGGAACTLL